MQDPGPSGETTAESSLKEGQRLKSLQRQMASAQAHVGTQQLWKEAYFEYATCLSEALSFLVGAARFKDKTLIEKRPEDFHSIIALSRDALGQMEYILEHGYAHMPSPSASERKAATMTPPPPNRHVDLLADSPPAKNATVAGSEQRAPHRFYQETPRPASLDAASYLSPPISQEPLDPFPSIKVPSSPSSASLPTKGKEKALPQRISLSGATAPQIPQSPLLQLHRDTAQHLYSTQQRLSSLQNALPPLSSAAAQSYGQSLQHLSQSVESQKSFLTSLSLQIELASTNTSVRDLHPHAVAFQLCLVDEAVFRRIDLAKDLFEHAPPARPNNAIQTATDFFNYTTRIIEASVLEAKDAQTRATTIRHWSKVAGRLYELRNFSSLKAVVSALSSPPIRRLKQTWELVSKKCTALLEAWGSLLSEQDNFATYREVLNEALAPTVPFLGVVLYDITYRKASHSRQREHSAASDSELSLASSVTLFQDAHIRHLLQQLEYFQHAASYNDDPALAHCAPKYLPTKLQHQAKNEAILSHLAAARPSSAAHVADTSPAIYMSDPSPTPAFATNLSGLASPGTSVSHYSISDPAFRLTMATDGLFVLHWLLSRSYLTEQMVDDLSRQREASTQEHTASSTVSADGMDQPLGESRPSTIAQWFTSTAIPPSSNPNNPPHQTSARRMTVKMAQALPLHHLFPGNPS